MFQDTIHYIITSNIVGRENLAIKISYHLCYIIALTGPDASALQPF